MAKINVTIPTFSRPVTPEEVAQLFCDLDNNEQAEFFNAVAELVDSWNRQFCFQMQFVVDSCKLNAGGIEIMRTIGEYGEDVIPAGKYAPDKAECEHHWAASYTADDKVDGWDCMKCGEHKDAARIAGCKCSYCEAERGDHIYHAKREGQ